MIKVMTALLLVAWVYVYSGPQVFVDVSVHSLQFHPVLLSMC